MQCSEQFEKVQEIDTKEYQPSEEDIMEYARSLGMEPEEDIMFMDIAKAGIVA